ncbi:DUF808 domain-containing protein [Schaalia sp. lx-100]|uniref:DUF808 domain-containing protein n=1 Tax=Schaalia sp. lx-100 TaxID=2899081 RepID=UPI001E355F68|nr:DUF808 domain-containing protein [Schaalia sp. lx-100]MCD4557511.1 DUF808 domain-containing protein [Schaalia sp. lx-100]
MAGGFMALMDDIASLAKLAAASVDDIALGAAKASAKTAGVVIDDTAVTPQYVRGLAPSRELPIIGRIARGSLINKLLIILPVALLLTWLAPWSLPIFLLCGGSYLCYEGAEKILHMTHLLSAHEDASSERDTVESVGREKKIISSAVRTDLILSAEIMLIALADLSAHSGAMRVAILVTVAFTMTFFVYGLVALLVKMDDFGALLVRRGKSLATVGRSIVRIMPTIFDAISVIGTLAMLWVGGHLVLSSAADLGFAIPHHAVEMFVHMIEAAGSFVMWCVETLLFALCGCVVGSIFVGAHLLASQVLKR